MAQFPSKKTIITGIDLDTDESRIKDDKAKFIKGLTLMPGKNPDAIDGEGDNAGVWKPAAGSEFIGEPMLPIGRNFCIGTFSSKETNELYVFVYNSLGGHLIYRVNGNGSIQTVYKGSCLNFQLEAQHYISEGRCELRKQYYIDFDGDQKLRKYLVFTDNFNDQRLISVEDSINTNSFNANQFPIFNTSAYACNPCYLIDLGVPTPMRCIGINNIIREDVEKSKQNKTVNKGWQWRIKQVDIFGRPSAHGIISDRYFTIIGSNCVQTNNKLSRCYKLTIDAGCPITNKIQIEFRTSSDEQWFLYDTIDKYNNCADVPWYERTINTQYPYDAASNTFAYTFCGDKECQPIDEAETSMLFIPIPIRSSGLMLIDKGLALSNNTRGREPWDCEELAKVNYSVTPPGGGCEASELRTIIVYVPIYNYMKNAITVLWEYDETENPTIFWGFGDSVYNAANPQAYGQYFVPGNFGFPGFLRGTQYSSMSQQVELDLTTGKDTYVGFYKVPKGQNRGPSFPLGNKIICQKFTFKVPPGEYSFAIGSHLVTLQEGYQYSSTNVFGTVKLNNITIVEADWVSDDKEIIINCCAGDVILNQPTSDTLLIFDATYGPYTCGYIYEDGNASIPLEYCPVLDQTGGASLWTKHTDHNGFFFGVGTGETIQLSVSVDSCTAQFGVWTPFSSDKYHNQRYNAYPGQGNDYPVVGRRLITGNIKLCNSDIGVAGALVVCKRGPFVNTSSSGSFTLIVHQRQDGFAGDLVFLSQSGGCRITKCDDNCMFCFDEATVAYKACGIVPRSTAIPDWIVDIIGNVKGIGNGTKRGFGITIFDGLGRASNIQIAEKHYLTMPSLIDTKQFKFSTVSWTFGSDIKFPDWAKFATFWWTKDLNYERRLMWVADLVQFVDNAGIVNKAAPTKIRIYYASLLAYNKQNNYGTNTTWQIQEADTSGQQVSVIGDYVEFVKNGDGTWFDKTITALITLDKDGQYFDLEYTDELSKLVDGAFYYLIRPKQCETEQIFYELCSTVRINNGIPESYSGTLNAFDSYFINRQIPIPFETVDKDGKAITSLNATWFSNFFEHDSPSDFWGTGLGNFGRINVKNPYERQVVNGTEVDKSKALVDRSSFNGLGYFTGDTKEFQEQQWGNILVGLVETNKVLFICEHNNFVVGYNDNIIRTNAQGQIVASSLDNQFGNPERKIGGDYGCQFEDINTIRKFSGVVFYLDRDRNALVSHDYSTATEVSLSGYSTYIAKKIATVKANNIIPDRGYDFIFIGGVDPVNGLYYLTVFGRGVGSVPSIYTNLELDHSLKIRETIEVDMATGTLISFPIFVPEYYGYLEGYKEGKSMFSMQFAKSWAHRVSLSVPIFNNFFGVQGPKVMTIVTNVDAEKVKRFMHTQVYVLQHKMIADLVVTETKQLSSISGSYWRFAEKFWSAPFLRNINTIPGIQVIMPLTEGEVLTGRWIKVRYVNEAADAGKYCEISAFVTTAIPIEKSGT